MMVMDRQDISKDEQNKIGKTATAEHLEEKQKTPGVSWLKHFRLTVSAIAALVLNFAKKTSTVSSNIFRDDEDTRIADDIKAAFRHIPLKKRGLGFLITGLIFAVYLLSGVYTVKPGEAAVSTIFGKQIR